MKEATRIKKMKLLLSHQRAVQMGHGRLIWDRLMAGHRMSQYSQAPVTIIHKDGTREILSAVQYKQRKGIHQ